MDNIITPVIEVAIRSLSASYGRDIAGVTANSERGQELGISARYENICDRNVAFYQLKLTNETRGYNHDEMSKIPASEADLDRQPHAHHNRNNPSSLEVADDQIIACLESLIEQNLNLTKLFLPIDKR